MDYIKFYELLGEYEKVIDSDKPDTSPYNKDSFREWYCYNELKKAIGLIQSTVVFDL